MARGNGERDAKIRFHYNGATSAEGSLLYAALDEASAERRGAELLRVVAMRGWIEMIHGTAAGERARLLRTIGISQEVISRIETLFPRPLFHAGSSPDTGFPANSDPGVDNVTQMVLAASKAAGMKVAQEVVKQPSEPPPPPPKVAEEKQPDMTGSAVQEPAAKQSQQSVVKPSKKLSRFGNGGAL